MTAFRLVRTKIMPPTHTPILQLIKLVQHPEIRGAVYMSGPFQASKR